MLLPAAIRSADLKKPQRYANSKLVDQNNISHNRLNEKMCYRENRSGNFSKHEIVKQAVTGVLGSSTKW